MFRTLVFCTLVFTAASSLVAQTAMAKGAPAPSDGVFMTAAEMSETRSLIEDLEAKNATLQADLAHEKNLHSIDVEACREARENFTESFVEWKAERKGYKDEVREWEQRYEGAVDYGHDLEKRHGGGFWNNRAVTFVTDFLIFGGSVWAVSTLRVR